MILEAGVICLALNIHYEAGVDPIEGQLAVALVTLNRAKHNSANLCNAVFRPGQFEWTAKIPPGPSRKQMEQYRSTAVVALSLHDFTNGADHFCHYKSYCSWAASMQFKGRWGSHNFYKAPRKGKR